MINQTQQMRRLEAQIENVLTAAYNHMKAIVSGLLQKFLKLMRQAPREFVWLYEGGKFPTLMQQITRQLDLYTSIVDSTVSTYVHEAAQLGGGAVRTIPLARLAGLGTVWTQKIASILMLAVQGLSYTVDANLETLLDEPLWRAITLASTEMWNAFRGAVLSAAAAMPGVLGWMWRTEEDERVCPFCARMDGTKHTFAEKFRTHPRCRCVPIPIPIIVQVGAPGVLVG